MIPSDSLAGRTALVTGGATRVGAAIVRQLHAAGAQVVIHYRSSESPALALQEALLERRPGSATLVQADLLDIAGLPDLVEEVLAVNGHLDVLVNNASNYYPTPLGSADEAQWEDLMGINAKAPFFLSQAAAPALKESRGAIVNLVDIHARRPNKGHPLYCMAKAANAMLVKSLARELAPEVRVNGVAPGAILWPEEALTLPEKSQVLERIPMGRPGSPEDIAETVWFLAAHGGYITGQILAVDGGRSVQQ